MGYIGNEPTTGHFPVQTNLAGDGSATTFTMDRAPATAGAIEVSVAGVLQPTTAYSVSGTTLTLPTSGSAIANTIPIFIRYLGETLTLPTIADGVVVEAKIGAGAVTASKLGAGAVTLAKIGADAVDGTKIADDAINSEHYTDASIDEAHIAADAVNFVTHLKAGTDGELITWDASGNPAAVPVGTATHVLTSGGTGVAPTFAAAAGGGLTQATEVNTTSGNNINFTGIPSGTTIIYLMFEGVSMTGSNNMVIQIGDTDGIETSGYIQDTAVSVSGLGSVISGISAGQGSPIATGVQGANMAVTGFMAIVRKNAATHNWVFSHSLVVFGYNVYRASMGGAAKSLSAELDRVRIDNNGSNTFDAGKASISYM